MSTDEVPSKLRDALAVALDDDAPRPARLRAIATLEHAREPHRLVLARALVPLLSRSGPDLAGRVHVALLVLAPALRLLREDRDGHDVFVVVDRGFALDELHKLYGPGEDLPPFLTPPEKPKPEAYRDPAAVREEEMRGLHAQRRGEHAAFLMKMQELGLDVDDLDDDEEVDVNRHLRRFVPLKGGTPWDSFAFVDDRDCVIDNGVTVVGLGTLRPGAWWSEATAGDHKGARRFRLGVAVDMAPRFTTRRERALEVGAGPRGGGGGLTITAGHADLDIAVDGRGVAIWVDVDPAGDEVVGITLTWSSWQSFRGDLDVRGGPPRHPAARRPRP